MGIPLLSEEGTKGAVSRGDKYKRLTSIEDDLPSPEPSDAKFDKISLDDTKIELSTVFADTPEEDPLSSASTRSNGRIWILYGRVKKLQEKHMIKIAWGCTVLGILCTAWIAPCFKLLGAEGVLPARRASWRSQVLLMLLSGPAILQYRSLTPSQKKILFTRSTLLQLLLCAFLWFWDLFLWSNALEYTTVSRSSIFSNSSSLMILVWCLIRRMPISALEIGGGVVGFSGMIFAVVGTNLFFASESEAASKSPITGDLLSLASAACVAAYVLNAAKARENVSVFIYTFSNTIFLMCALSTASMISEGSDFSTSSDGLFGWANMQFFMVVALLSVVAGLIGFNLNNLAIKYVPPLGYSLLALCDPFISGTYSWIIGADGVPGIFTCFGGIITIGGIVMLMVGTEKRKKKEHLQKLQKETGVTAPDLEMATLGDDFTKTEISRKGDSETKTEITKTAGGSVESGLIEYRAAENINKGVDREEEISREEKSREEKSREEENRFLEAAIITSGLETIANGVVPDSSDNWEEGDEIGLLNKIVER